LSWSFAGNETDEKQAPRGKYFEKHINAWDHVFFFFSFFPIWDNLPLKI
jgi:hypothetical protein